MSKSLDQFHTVVGEGGFNKNLEAGVEKVIGRAVTIDSLQKLAAKQGVQTDPPVALALKTLRDSVGLEKFSGLAREAKNAIAEASKIRNSAPSLLYESVTKGMTGKQIDQLRSNATFEGEAGAFLTPQLQLKATGGGTGDTCHLAQVRLLHGGRPAFLPREKEAIDRSTARHLIKYLDSRNKIAIDNKQHGRLRSIESFRPESQLDKGILVQAFDDAVAENLGFNGDPKDESSKEGAFRAMVLQRAQTHASHFDDSVRDSSSGDLDLLRSMAGTERFAELYSTYRGTVDSARSNLLKDQMNAQVSQRVSGQIEEARNIVLVRLKGDKDARASDPIVNKMADLFMQRKEGQFTAQASTGRLEMAKPGFFTQLGERLGTDMRKLNQERLQQEHAFEFDETHYQMAMNQLLTADRDCLTDAVIVPQRDLTKPQPT